MAEYEKLLERALERIPKVLERERFKIPEADVVVVGNRTILRNLREVATALNREPSHLMKYLLRELGTAGGVEGSQAVFQGKFSKSVLDERVARYTEEFVLCRECGRPDTRFLRIERAYVLRCEACGARASVRVI